MLQESKQLNELKFRFGDNMLDENGGVDKNLLFFIMENNPLERQEIEDTIHALVKQQIELFSKNETNNVNWQQ